MTVLIEKPPPHSVDAEQACLAACMINSEALAYCLSRLRPGHFYVARHQEVFKAIQAIHATGKPVDLLTVSEALGTQLEACGGFTYLAQLSNTMPTTANIEGYVDILREKHERRQYLRAGQEMIDLAFADVDRDERRAKAGQTFLQLDDPSSVGPVCIGDTAAERFQEVCQQRTVDALQMPWGPMNKILLGGLRKGDYVILAADPGGGKTVMAENIARHIAKQQKPVLFFSLEMDRDDLVDRSYCSEAHVHGTRYQARNLRPEETKALEEACSKFATIPFFIDDQGDLTPIEMLARAQRIKAKCGLALVVVDYIQLIHTPGQFKDRRTEIDRISRQLKLMAKALQVPVLALSQLNREGREQKEPPKLKNLKESGSLEQDADVVLFIWYDPEKNKIKPDSDTVERNRADIIVAKHRKGPKGMFELDFQGEYYSFLWKRDVGRIPT